MQVLSYHGTLYAFVGKMLAHDKIVSCMACVYDEKTFKWEQKNDIAPLFLPNTQPAKMANGNWIMAGRVAAKIGDLPLTPAVAISEGDDILGKWELIRIQENPFPKNNFPETALWISPNGKLTAFVRSSGKQPKIYTSENFGRDWEPVSSHDFFANISKMYAGELSTGQHYIVFNAPLPSKNGWKQRGTLAIALTGPGERA